MKCSSIRKTRSHPSLCEILKRSSFYMDAHCKLVFGRIVHKRFTSLVKSTRGAELHESCDAALPQPIHRQYSSLSTYTYNLSALPQTHLVLGRNVDILGEEHRGVELRNSLWALFCHKATCAFTAQRDVEGGGATPVAHDPVVGKRQVGGVHQVLDQEVVPGKRKPTCQSSLS
jgi:hypothetical protein